MPVGSAPTCANLRHLRHLRFQLLTHALDPYSAFDRCSSVFIGVHRLPIHLFHGLLPIAGLRLRATLGPIPYHRSSPLITG
jgi:hypothetical protein